MSTVRSVVSNVNCENRKLKQYSIGAWVIAWCKLKQQSVIAVCVLSRLSDFMRLLWSNEPFV